MIILGQQVHARTIPGKLRTVIPLRGILAEFLHRTAGYSPLPLGVRYMEYLFMVSGALHSLA